MARRSRLFDATGAPIADTTTSMPSQRPLSESDRVASATRTSQPQAASAAALAGSRDSVRTA
jgi:hypothetical protein